MTLQIRDQQHYEEIVAFADRVGLRQQLDDKLLYLDGYAENGEPGKSRCILARDFAPYSFGFVMQVKDSSGEYRTWFQGGVIFHGHHDNGGDGSYPTLAVSLSPGTGWQIHT